MNFKGLDDYQEVPDRIRLFFDKYPEGSLQRKEWHVEMVEDRTYIVYTALAYRTPDDRKPGQGTAWEPWPGTTPYTKNSELMNAETSAWGRALVALGFVAKKIASAEEVRNRSAEKSQPNGKPITLDAAHAIATRALEVVDFKRLELAATHIAKREVGKINSEHDAISALKDFTPDQAKRLAEWVEKKASEKATA